MSRRSRPSPWKTTEAHLTYLSGALWAIGLVLVLLTNGPDQAGWLRIRLDAAGLLFLGGALVGGWNFFPKGVRAILEFKLDMNFLMTVAIIGAVLIGEPLEAAAIAFLFSFAEILERSAVVRARNSVDELLRLAPERATVVDETGAEQMVPTSELRIGDLIRVRPGEKIPIDGRIVDGQSGINEANVTGESVPVAKAVGDPVYASTLSTDGYLEIEATTDAGDTTLDRIARLVRQAQSRKSPTEMFVKKFARYYTPAVTVLALLVMVLPPLLGFGSGMTWFVRGLTLLVIACPCALVIATPVTIVSALTAAARHGVLIKGGEYIESLGATCAMAFDKTGTLTYGRPEVTDVVPLAEVSSADLLAVAGAVEQRSEHPIARAIANHAGNDQSTDGKPYAVENFQAHPGLGVSADVEGMSTVVGTVELIERLALGGEFIDVGKQFEQLERAGKTVVVIAQEGKTVGLIALADTLRPEAPTVLARLRDDGVHHQIILTGDQQYSAAAVGEAVGTDEIHWELKPEQKVTAVRDIVKSHKQAAMVGDGVNDAPALAAADVGIAMGGAGSPATIETADIVLMADDLSMLPYARRIARLARRLVRLNIGLALGLKALLAVGAIGGFVSLMVAVLVGDMGATIVVTLNAMRLARVKP